MAKNRLLEFRQSPIHGIGGFARLFIPKGTRIVEYRGKKISKAESLRLCQQNNTYIFSLDDKHDLNGNVPWNPARFLNHSCAPNCEAIEKNGRIWIVARRDIQPGEEITFNYGYDLVDYKDYPCRCGSPACVGYMVAEEFFPKFKRGREPKKRTGRKKAVRTVGVEVAVDGVRAV